MGDYFRFLYCKSPLKPTVEQIGELLALRREERPDAGYWQDFLCEFHQKQREEAAGHLGLAGIFGRAAAWFSDIGPSKWGYGAGLAYASVAVVALLFPKDPGVERMTPIPVGFQMAPSAILQPIQQLNQLDLSPSSRGFAGEHVF